MTIKESKSVNGAFQSLSVLAEKVKDHNFTILSDMITLSSIRAGRSVLSLWVFSKAYRNRVLNLMHMASTMTLYCFPTAIWEIGNKELKLIGLSVAIII